MHGLWSDRRVAEYVSRFLLVSLFLSLLPVSAISILPEEAAAQPAAGPIYVCAHPATTTIRYVLFPSQCTPSEVLLNLNGDPSVTLCYLPATRELRYRFGQPCRSGEQALTLPGEQATTLCLTASTGRRGSRSMGSVPVATARS